MTEISVDFKQARYRSFILDKKTFAESPTGYTDLKWNCIFCKCRDLELSLVVVFAKRATLAIMTPQDSIQSSFLDQVRSRLPANLSFVDELAELLNVSRDSAYRRMRGETVLSLDEVKKICNHFGVSLDSLLSPAAEVVSFQVRGMDEGEFSIERFLKSVLSNLEMISGFQDKELIYHAKDLPIFHFFQYPRLAAFKIYFWVKTFTASKNFTGEKYNADLVPRDLIAIGERIWAKYAPIHSTEIISGEILTITLRHIRFAFDCGLIEKPEAQGLCMDCATLLNHLREQAELGLKKTFGSDEKGGKLDLYLNEVLIADNTVFMKMGDKRVTILTHNNFNILATSHESFCRMTENHLINMMNKSSLISTSATRERSRFFNDLLEEVQRVKDKLG